ncbi:MFS transporter [Corynebacterium sp. CCUG 65737]|uniref:MFS transporter n=1 Tax=Corynebacterium sp. CCUG 65737 TaxID=2823889 RepID=UPI0021087677|nr:MFS transporter [Corynebacterium sp. CCUG 65737]
MPSSLPWLTALFIATLALGTDEFVIAGVLNLVAADLNTTPGAAGQLVTVFATSFAIGAPVLAVWLNRFGHKKALLAGLLIFAAANLGCAAATTLATLLALRVLAGLSAAAVSTAAFSAAAKGAPDGKQGKYLSIVTAGLTVALFTGVPLGTWFGAVFSWRTTFILIGAVSLMSAIVIHLSMPELPHDETRSVTDQLAPLKNPQVARMVAAIFLCGAGGLMFYSYLAPITVGILGSEELLPFILLVVGLVGVGSALLGGNLTDQIGSRRARITVLGGHAATLGILALLGCFTPPTWLFIAAVGFWALFAWALNPPMQASTIAAAPEAPMTAVALNISGLYLGTAAAGAIGGALLDHFGTLSIPVAGTVFLVCALLAATPPIPDAER